MSILAEVLRELEAGADAATVARRLQISDDLAAAAIDHWVEAGRAVRPARATGPAGLGSTAPGSRPPGAACPGCEPRPLWRRALACHGCPFATPPPS